MSIRLRWALGLTLGCAGALTLLTSPVHAAGEGAAPRGSGLAVLPFRVASTAHGAGREIGIDLQDSLHTALTPVLRGKSVTLIERFRLKEVLQENKISDTGIIDPAEAVRVGGKAGARYILLGTVTQVETLRESEVKKARSKYPEGVPRELEGILRKVGDKIRLPIPTGRDRSSREEDTFTTISVEARIVSISAADGEASFKVSGVARGKRPNYAEAVSSASELLAREIGAAIQKDGRIRQPVEPDPKADSRTPVKPAPEPAAEGLRLEGRILSAETQEEIGVRLQKDHGLREGARLRMRWLQPLAGDTTVRRTRALYRVEVVESDVGGVILKILATEKGEGIPEKDAMVVLEPDKG